MKIKKRVIPMLAGVLTTVMLTCTASAHPYDYWQGKYIGKSNAEILLRIDTSAQTDLLTWAGVYQYGYDWNNISSKVNVSLVLAGSGTPSIYGSMPVLGEKKPVDLFGRIAPYNSEGQLESEASENEDWMFARLYMNTNPETFNNASNKTAAAKKTFLHEVGHLLKLCHPEDNSSLIDHTIGGRPSAVMNQGLPYPKVYETSPTITSHDKSCLIAKWGA